MARVLVDDPVSRIRRLIPSTMRVLGAFLGNAVLRQHIPFSSATGRQITVWPECMVGANDVPVGTLVQIGGTEAALWANNFVFDIRTRDDGTLDAALERSSEAVYRDDFQITIARTTSYEWSAPTPLFSISVQHLIEATEEESKLAGILIAEIDDERLARLAEIALDGRRYDLPRREALRMILDQAMAFGAERKGLRWELSSERLPTEDLDLETFGPRM